MGVGDCSTIDLCAGFLCRYRHQNAEGDGHHRCRFLRAGDLRLRLHGIDAPELRQTCLDKASQPYRCGQEAADFLRSMIEIGAEIQCQHLDTDRYKRWVVKCFHNGEDIGEAVVRAGWALAYRRYAKDYIEAENQAERAGRGIWQGSFTRPEIWRREQRKK